MNQKWDDRYRDVEFAYGKEPNIFFKEWLLKLDPGSILMPADGEGRNGVFAAQLGWKVDAFDISIEGKNKALQLAKENNVSIHYIVEDLDLLQYEKETFDAIGLIYAHFPAEKKAIFHKKLNTYLKPGGVVILEGFSKNHINYNKRNPKVGGPKDLDTLFSEAEIINDFKNYDTLLLKEEEILLNEGKYHIGKGSVIRFIGRKK